MKTYELTYIISCQISQTEAGSVAKEVESFIQSKEGVILKSEKTLPKTLAYPIKKQASGYFALLDLQISEDKVKEIKDKLDKDNKILRSFIMIKKPIGPIKERRTRKPEFATAKSAQSPFKREEKQEEVNPEELGKKLDEILGE